MEVSNRKVKGYVVRVLANLANVRYGASTAGWILLDRCAIFRVTIVRNFRRVRASFPRSNGAQHEAAPTATKFCRAIKGQRARSVSVIRPINKPSRQLPVVVTASEN